MNRAPAVPQLALIYTPEELAAARWLVTNGQSYVHLDAATRRASIDIAWLILRKDRATRLPQPPKPNQTDHQTARVLRVPLAVFQAGPKLLRTPRHRITINPSTPGDAA